MSIQESFDTMEVDSRRRYVKGHHVACVCSILAPVITYRDAVVMEGGSFQRISFMVLCR